MKILFTGGSSFTGMWFVRQLASAGHKVWCTFQRPLNAYEGLRGERVAKVCEIAHSLPDCSFGSERFLEAMAAHGPFDVLCHHGADVTNYKSPNFDPLAATAKNTHNLVSVLHTLKDHDCHRIVLTGSVFEPGEGRGSDGLPAVSPYGLSKGMTAQMFRYYCWREGIALGKFVIPNPFGPYEEARFTTYLATRWQAGEVAPVSSPSYHRDNIHVSLLALAYVQFVESLKNDASYRQVNPSGYAEEQGAFVQRFAAALSPLLQLPCKSDLQVQTEFPEPKIRLNTEPVDGKQLGWDEGGAWKALADWYNHRHQQEARS